MELPLKDAAVGAYTIRYADVGSGTPVVLIHGLAGDHSAWMAQIEVLSRTHRVIAFLMEQPQKFMSLLTGWLQAH